MKNTWKINCLAAGIRITQQPQCKPRSSKPPGFTDFKLFEDTNQGFIQYAAMNGSNREFAYYYCPSNLQKIVLNIIISGPKITPRVDCFVCHSEIMVESHTEPRYFTFISYFQVVLFGIVGN
jgi:hypothetical protein